MGNCMETCTQKEQEKQMQQDDQRERASPFGQESSFGKGGIRVKIVLTKEELQWLMLQLQDKQGKKLEDVFGEIERAREKAEGWKPSLESIMETPEVHDMER
uniref:Uncharacterized protein n=1 Tax=Fagus sylvatica TaxID=28930 RepID=A0A2N9J5Q3_FAGSY